MKQGRNFEEAVLADLAERWPLLRIAERPDQARSVEAAQATWRAMADGAPIIAQAVLHDAAARMYGVADLLVRADVLGELWPEAFNGEQLALPLAGFEHGRHYRVVDVKFSTLELLKAGGLGVGDVDRMAQAWTYNQALGRAQGYTPHAAYVVGRGWKQGQERGERSWERLARVPRDAFVRGLDDTLENIVASAAAWVRRVRTEGAEWRVLPLPSVPELWPNMKAKQDFPWHNAKAEIAAKLRDLTLLPRVNREHRTRAHALGVTRWDDPRASAAFLGVTGERESAILDAIVAVNRDPGLVVRPARVVADEGRWRVPAPVEVFVDFEFASDLADDFGAFPYKGGQPIIFQIGSGTYRDRHWRFRQFTVDDLNVDAEAAMIDAWLAHLAALTSEAGVGLGEIRLIHWSPAETSNYESPYESARRRHPDRNWPTLDWYDLLARVVRAEPVVVKNAFSFGLKPVARALYDHGLIDTHWGEGLADGAGAMVGAWVAAREARSRRISLSQTALMTEIARYNEIDCRVMAEILDYLRRER